jgi:hypothetical protein
VIAGGLHAQIDRLEQAPNARKEQSVPEAQETQIKASKA